MLAFATTQEQISELFALQAAESSYEILPTDNISELVNTLKNVSHYSYIIIDIACFNQSESEIEKALFLLKSINATPLIILARGRPRGDPFLFNLVELKLYNFVNAVDPITAKQQVEACLIGRTLQDVEHFLPTIQQKEKRSWFSRKPEKKDSSPISIAIAGICPRIGTTTQAVRLVKWLTYSKKNACYVESNSSGHIELIGSVYADARAVDESTIEYLGVLLGSKTPKKSKDFDYLIYDCGNDIEGEMFTACSKQIIVAGETAWEMASLANCLSLPQENDERYFIFSFTSEEERQDILSFMGTRFKKTFFAEFVPDMFSTISQKEGEIFKKIIES